MNLTQLKQYVQIHFANGAASMAEDSLSVALTQIITLVIDGAPLAGNMSALISDTSTDPGTPTTNLVYITITPGSYTHFLSAPATPIVVPANAIIAFLTFDTITGYWTLSSVTDSALGAIVAVTNKATGGSAGSAAATVDIANILTVNQTTAAQTLTLASPTASTKVRNILVQNIGSADFTMYSVIISAGGAMEYVWDGAAWKALATSTFGAIITAAITATALTASGVVTAAGMKNTGQIVLGTPVAITNKATGGVIGTAAATVDISSVATINQTTAAQDVTLPAPTSTVPIIQFTLINIGSADVTAYGKTLKATTAGETRATFIWNGSAWK